MKRLRGILPNMRAIAGRDGFCFARPFAPHPAKNKPVPGRRKRPAGNRAASQTFGLREFDLLSEDMVMMEEVFKTVHQIKMKMATGIVRVVRNGACKALSAGPKNNGIVSALFRNNHFGFGKFANFMAGTYHTRCQRWTV